MAVKIEVVVFWIVPFCSDIVGYQCFGGPCCLHLQGEDGVYSNIFASLCIDQQCWKTPAFYP